MALGDAAGSRRLRPSQHSMQARPTLTLRCCPEVTLHHLNAYAEMVGACRIHSPRSVSDRAAARVGGRHHVAPGGGDGAAGAGNPGIVQGNK